MVYKCFVSLSCCHSRSCSWTLPHWNVLMASFSRRCWWETIGVHPMVVQRLNHVRLLECSDFLIHVTFLSCINCSRQDKCLRRHCDFLLHVTFSQGSIVHNKICASTDTVTSSFMSRFSQGSIVHNNINASTDTVSSSINPTQVSVSTDTVCALPLSLEAGPRFFSPLHTKTYVPPMTLSIAFLPEIQPCRLATKTVASIVKSSNSA